jgi:muconolactone delta-isomerase
MSKFLVIEKPATPPQMASPDSPEGAQMMKMFESEIEYKVKLQKQGKIVGGGPFLDIGALCYILDVPNVEEMGEIFFNSPLNPWTQREVHPLGTFSDTLEGMKAMQGS